MASTRTTGKKCIERLGDGRRCNERIVNGSHYCKKHQPNKKNNKDRKKASFSKAEKYGLWGTIISIFIGLIIFGYQTYTGPTNENQQKIIEQTNEDTLKAIFKSLIPQDSTEFYKQQKEFNTKLNEFSDLVSKLEKLDSKISKSVDSLKEIQSKIDSLTTIWKSQVYSMEFKYKNIIQKTENPLKDIFKYGYTTIFIDPSQKIHLIDQYNNEIEGPVFDWKDSKFNVSEKQIVFNISKIGYRKPVVQITGSTIIISRTYSGIGRSYSLEPSIGDIENVLSIIAENQEGILLVIGFKEMTHPGKPNNQIAER